MTGLLDASGRLTNAVGRAGRQSEGSQAGQNWQSIGENAHTKAIVLLWNYQQLTSNFSSNFNSISQPKTVRKPARSKVLNISTSLKALEGDSVMLLFQFRPELKTKKLTEIGENTARAMRRTRPSG